MLSVLVGVLSFTSPAQAERTRSLHTSFATVGSGDGELNDPASVAVREPTLSEPGEDLYVADEGNNRVEQFTSTGTFIAVWGWGVSGGVSYQVCTSGCSAGTAGPGEGQLDSPRWIAVDNSKSSTDPSEGDVYVGNTGANTIQKYGPNGEFVAEITGTTSSFGSLCGIGVDPAGELWVYQCSGQIDNFTDAKVNEFSESRQSPRGVSPGFAVDSEDNLYVDTGIGNPAKLNRSGTELISGVGSETATGLAVNESTDDVLVDTGGSVAEYNPDAGFIERFGPLSSGAGLAVSVSSGEVVVADPGANAIAVFGPIAILPTVSVTSASGIAKHPHDIEATLNGTVEPEGEAVTECYFEYGTTLPSVSTVPCSPEPASSTTPVSVHAAVEKLAAGTSYYYRIVAKNKNGSNTSGIESFATPATVTLSIEKASAVQKHTGQIEATLNASVNPEGIAVTECTFEYGTSLPSGKTAPCEPSPGTSAKPVTVHAKVSGLANGVTYLYTVTGTNEFGPTTSPIETFQTPVAVALSVQEATDIGENSATDEIEATLNGTVKPEGEAVTECYFEYGTSLPSGRTLPCEPAPGASAEPVAVTAVASGLEVEKHYDYRLVAKNVFGVSEAASANGFTAPPAVLGVSACSAAVLNESATLQATLKTSGIPTTWFFEYRTANSTEAWAKSAEGGVEKPVSKEEVAKPMEKVTGLSRDTAYECRIVAHNVFGSTAGALGEFVTALPPEVESESYSQVGFSTATLSARIDVWGAPDVYTFQYATQAEFEAGKGAYTQETPPLTVSHPIRGETEVFTQIPSGLQPSETYHFRVVVTQPEEGGTAYGQDDTFGTFPESGAELPDGRVYELVSPVQANGASVYVPNADNGRYPTATELPFQVASNGEAVAYAGAPAGGGNGYLGEGAGNEFLATRSASGWSASDVSPGGGGTSPVFLGFSSDLAGAIIESREPLSAEAPGEGFDVLYTRALAGGVYQPLFTEAPKHRTPEDFGTVGTLGPAGAGLAYAGASADFKDILFEANDALIAGIADPGASANDLYDSVEGRLSVVNYLPGSVETPNATFGAPNETGNPADPPDFGNVISSNGSLIFWTDLSDGTIYVRENGTSTVQVSAGAARYWTATPDGRFAFYTEGEKLYRFQVEGAKREELAGSGAAVLGVIGTSEDGEYVYFVAEGALAQGATAKAPNLYLLHGGTTRFIAILAPEGPAGDEGNSTYGEGDGSFGDWEPGLGHRTAEVTPNGQSIVFQSVQPLTGYDSGGLAEVFVYDSEERGTLYCASCDPSGEAPPVTGVKAASYLPVSWSRTYMPTWISENGSRVFFDSFEPLAAPDSNRQQDVYEWERPGSGECQTRVGCDYLLSGATSRSGSYLLGSSASGNDVFFVTDARLVPQDQDESEHLYDDRVGGIKPSSPEACSGSTCQQVPVVPPIFARPPTSTFIGVGNFPALPAPSPKPVTVPAAKTCQKGYVLKSGKCVKKTKKKKSKKAKHARRSAAERARRARARKAHRGGAR